MLLVGGMLLIALVSVATRWLTERRKAAVVENQLRERCANLEQKLNVIIGSLPAEPALSPADLRSETVTVNGETRDAYRLTAAQASELGLGEGEVLVFPVPSTADQAGDEVGDNAER
jgi:hypothetical protein